jgi:hypothetical protein
MRNKKNINTVKTYRKNLPILVNYLKSETKKRNVVYDSQKAFFSKPYYKIISHEFL